MAELFGCSSDNISLHLKNIFEAGELEKDSVTEKISATAADGKNYPTNFYNLDAIISVGYRVILFDLAYNKLATDKKIKSPKFIIHDQLELTDITPKEEVFVKILPQLDCQFIVPSIRSSLTVLGEDFIKENTILELSKTNKLFRIEEYDSIEKYKY